MEEQPYLTTATRTPTFPRQEEEHAAGGRKPRSLAPAAAAKPQSDRNTETAWNRGRASEHNLPSGFGKPQRNLPPKRTGFFLARRQPSASANRLSELGKRTRTHTNGGRKPNQIRRGTPRKPRYNEKLKSRPNRGTQRTKMNLSTRSGAKRRCRDRGCGNRRGRIPWLAAVAAAP
jgi:hypothetical protein